MSRSSKESEASEVIAKTVLTLFSPYGVDLRGQLPSLLLRTSGHPAPSETNEFCSDFLTCKDWVYPRFFTDSDQAIRDHLSKPSFL